jgi:isopentenyl diphosphate isomerase/L-lactate dehydrogenase-like FMN-dependent dehydrogenase
MLSNYNLVEIDSLEVESNPSGVAYDFEVEEDHSYNVGGIAVHNSICTTRIQTGHGMPTLQSVIDCARSDRDVLLIADGGIRSTWVPTW